MSEDSFSLDEIAALEEAELHRDVLGFTIDSYFNETPFLKSNDFETESIARVGEKTLNWTGIFNKAFGSEQVRMSLWMIDRSQNGQEDRYIFARFSDNDGEPLNILPVLGELLGLDSDNELSIAAHSTDKETQNIPHHLQFNEAIKTHVWLSSHELTAEQITLLFAEVEIPDLPDELATGFQWQNKISFTAGNGLAHWFESGLFDKLSVKSIYRLRVRANELELRLSIPDESAKVKQHPSTENSLELTYLSIFFDHKKDQLSFSGFGMEGGLIITYLEKELPLIGFGGRINTKQGILNLWANNFPTIDELKTVFITDENKPVLEIPNFGIDQLRVKHVEFQLDVFNFDVRRASLVLDAHPLISLNEHLSFYPKLSAEIKNPLNSDEREVNWQLEGWVNAFEAIFSASYSRRNELFHFSLNNGELSSKAVMEAMSFPTIKKSVPASENFDITIVDLEFTAEHTSDNWMYAGGITISNNWEWKLAEDGFKMELAGLHGEFQYKNELTHFVLGGQFIIGDLVLEASVTYESEDGFYLQAIMNSIEVDLDKFPAHLGLETHIENDNQEIIEDVQSSFNLPVITINQMMVECFFPENKEDSKSLSFVTSIAVDPKALPIPLDAVFLQLDWDVSLKWSVLAHFNFEHTFEDGSKGSMELFLRSEKTDEQLSFSGGLENLHINDLINFIETRFEVSIKDELPHFLSQSEIKNLQITLSEKEGDWSFDFNFEAVIPFDDESGIRELTTGLQFRVTKNQAKKEKASWTVDFYLKMDLELENESKLGLTITFHHQKGINHLLVDFEMQNAIDISKVISHFLPSTHSVPSISLHLQEVYFALYNNSNDDTVSRNMLMGAEVGTEIKLKDVNFLKQWLKYTDVKAGLKDMILVYAKDAWTKEELKALNSFSKGKGHQLPVPESKDDGLPGGISVSGTLLFGKIEEFFETHNHITKESGSDNETENGDNSAKIVSSDHLNDKAKENDSTGDIQSSSLTKWFNINKDLGPLHFQRLGIQFDYEEMKLWILIDAGLQIAILSVSVDGMGVGSGLNEFRPEFRLKGLGVDFRKGPLEIGGALLYEKNPKDEDEISLKGMISLKFKEIGLTALGSYRSMKDPETKENLSPSVLMYGILNAPIGGPPFFMVEGLAAGLGIHRKAEFPAIEKLAKFPLISSVIDGNEINGASQLSEAISKLEEAVPVNRDHYFFAAGIKFNTFKLLDSFVLLMLSLGEEVEVDLLGYSELVMPKDSGSKAMAKVRLLIHAAFRPGAGTLQVEARLDPENSYLLSKKCHLQGGFAFYAWFKGRHPSKDGGTPGDFVLTLGGYHPRFIIPEHFPRVPRLGFQWEVDKHTHIKGELYFALTPLNLMAGGLLEAAWSDDHLSASFLLSLNMLINWQPFHYEADMELNVKGSYHNGIFIFNGELNMKVEIWGPEFGGRASFELLFIKISATFGASEEKTPSLLDWPDFVSNMLSNHEESPFNARITNGRLAENSEEEINNDLLGHVNPAGFELAFESQVPVTHYQLNKDPSVSQNNFGIPAMGIETVSSRLTIVISDENSETDQFEVTPIQKNGPAALWGTKLIRELTDDPLVENLMLGFRITPKPDRLRLTGDGIILEEASPTPKEVNQLDITEIYFEEFGDKRDSKILTKEQEDLISHW